MVRSASAENRRRKNAYVALSAVILVSTVIVDILTSKSGSNMDDDDETFQTKGNSGTSTNQQQFLPIFTTLAFIVVVLVGIFTIGTREKWESENDAMGGVSSAYSIFNEGGRTMMGSMTAKELDGQLRGGPAGGYDWQEKDANGKNGGTKKRYVQPKQYESAQMSNDDKGQAQLRKLRAEAAMKRMKGS